MKKRVLIFAGFFGLFLLSFMGCQEVSNDQTGRIIVKITDAPFPIDFIEDASVTITKVEMRLEEMSEESEEGEVEEGEVKEEEVEEGEVEEEEVEEGEEGDGKESPFITLFEGSETFNLLELRNGVMATFLDLEIPVGNYNLIRIYVENARIAVKGYDTYSVKVPSGSQTGVKVFMKPSLKVAGGLTAEVVLDFSLEKSFVLKGNMNTPAGIKGFNFKPVIRAVNNTIAGSVEGVVSDTDGVLLPGVLVSIGQDAVLSSATTDGDGFYAMPGILPGIYTMSAEFAGYNTLSVEGVEVVEGNKTVQDFALEPVSSVTD